MLSMDNVASQPGPKSEHDKVEEWQEHINIPSPDRVRHGMNTENPIELFQKDRIADLDNEVKFLESKRSFLKASQTQREYIKLRVQLRSKIHFLTYEERDSEEKYADLLAQCCTVGQHKKALDTLKEQLKICEDEGDSHDPLQAKERKARLVWKICSLSLRKRLLGQSTLSSVGLENVAGMLWEALDTCTTDLQLQIARLLTRCYELGDMPAAQKLKEAVEDKFGHGNRRNPKDIDHDGYFDEAGVVVLDWCERQQYDVLSPSFRFDALVHGKLPPLHNAVKAKACDIVESMLVEVENVDLRQPETCMTPLMEAAQSREPKIARMLISHHASLNVYDANRRSLLHLCQLGTSDSGTTVANIFLDHNEDLLDLQDDEGRTALFMASQDNRTRMVKSLLERKPSIDVADRLGKTPLYAFVDSLVEGTENKTALQTAALLLNAGANPNVADNMNKSPLYIACRRGLKTLVALLLFYGAEVDQPSYTGHTALIAAILKGDIMIVRELMQRGANPLQCDDSGRNGHSYCKAPNMGYFRKILDGNFPRRPSHGSQFRRPRMPSSSTPDSSRRPSTIEQPMPSKATVPAPPDTIVPSLLGLNPYSGLAGSSTDFPSPPVSTVTSLDYQTVAQSIDRKKYPTSQSPSPSQTEDFESEDF